MAASDTDGSPRPNRFPKRLPTYKLDKDKSLVAEEEERTKRCITFLDASPEPFHVVNTVAKRLAKAGYIPLNENEVWRSGKL